MFKDKGLHSNRGFLKSGAFVAACALTFGLIAPNSATAISANSIVGCPVSGGSATVIVPSSGYVITFTQPDKRAWFYYVEGTTRNDNATWYLPSSYTIPWQASTLTYAYEFWEWDDSARGFGIPGPIGDAPACTLTFTYDSSGGGGSGDKTDRNYGHSDKTLDPNRDRKEFSPTPKK